MQKQHQQQQPCCSPATAASSAITPAAAIRENSGGWRSGVFLLVNYGLTTLAFFGVGVNLVLFLRRVVGQGNAAAANNVSKWTGAVYILSLLGAFLSDSYWGQYLTCLVFQFIFVAGLAMLTLTSWLLLIRPNGCGGGGGDDGGATKCEPITMAGKTSFYLSIYLVALGNGGYQPCIAAFGADQFDDVDEDPTAGESRRQSDSKAAFFSYLYLSLNVGSLASNTILAYYEDSGEWVTGFSASAAASALALALFLLGASGYRRLKPSGNPLTRIAQVLVATLRKGGGCRNPWQTMEVKRMARLLPIWLCTIPYSLVFSQMASVFVEQGAAMDTGIGGVGGGFRVPAASMSVFDIAGVLAFIAVYRKVLLPFDAGKGRLTELRRMGAGLVVGMMAMATAGAVETERLKRAASGRPMTILWQVPQYVLIGASEVFMYVGQLEFFNGEAPEGMKSIGSSLCMASISLGNFASIAVVDAVTGLTSGGGGDDEKRKKEKPGWIPIDDLDAGRLDRFFFLLAALMMADFVVYLICAKRYKYADMQLDDDEDINGGGGGDHDGGEAMLVNKV